MGYDLVVQSPFSGYKIGDIITDPATVSAIEASYPDHVLRISDGSGASSTGTTSPGTTTSTGAAATGTASTGTTAAGSGASITYGTAAVVNFDLASFALTGTTIAATTVTVASVAALRTLPAGPYQQVTTKGHATLGDGGDRDLWWHPTSTDPDDGIMTFLPNGYTGAGRWKAVLPNPRCIPAQWAGCAGDGVTDDSAAFLSAMTLAATLGVPVYASRLYLLSIAVTDLDVWIVGEGTLLWQQGKNCLSVRRTPGAAIAVSAVGSVQLGTWTGNSYVDYVKTSATLSVASVAGISQGQIYVLSSNDPYPWYQFASGSASAYVYQTQLVRVAGIGLAFVGGTAGQWQEEQTVTGATSGATAQLKSVSDGTTGTLVFNAISGTFATGEPLQVGGATFGQASGAAFLILAEKLYDTYATAVQIQLYAEARLVLEGITIDVPAGANPEGVVGAANRLPGLDLRGVYRPRIRDVTIKNGWTRAIQLSGCWQGDIDVFIERLPDDANLSEQAYGYGVEFYGCTDGTRVRVLGGNCRHAVTSNVTWNSSRTYADLWQTGCPKHCLIHDSVIRDCFNASFDTHWGCYFFTFDACVSLFSTHLNRNVSASIGFQNRGFGTTYQNCRAMDAVIGFNSLAEQAAGVFVHTVSYLDCRADSFQLSGFQSGAAAQSGNHRLLYVDCVARGNGSATATNFIQYAWNFPGSTYVELRNCKAECFNGSAFHHGGGGGRVFILGFFVDFRENPNYAPSAFRMECLTSASPPAGVSTATPFGPLEFFVSGLAIYYDLTHGAPAGIFRNPTAGGILAVALSGSIAQLNSGRAPLIYPGGGLTTISRAQDWGDRAANPTVLPQASRWFAPAASVGTGTQAVGVLTALPIVIASNMLAASLAIVVTTASSGGGTMRLGLYGDSAGLPGALIADAGTVSTDTAGAAAAALSNVALTNGIYWLACQTAKPGTGVAALNVSTGAGQILGGATPQAALGAGAALGVVASGYSTVTTLPAAFPTPVITSAAVVPIVAVQVSPSTV